MAPLRGWASLQANPSPLNANWYNASLRSDIVTFESNLLLLFVHQKYQSKLIGMKGHQNGLARWKQKQCPQHRKEKAATVRRGLLPLRVSSDWQARHNAAPLAPACRRQSDWR